MRRVFRRNRAQGCLLLLLIALPLRAQETYYTTLDLAHPLDADGSTTRDLALGSSTVASPDGSGGLFLNPAGLSLVSAFEASLHHQSWLGGLRQDTLLAALPSRSAGTFALGASGLDFGGMDGFDASGTPTGSYQALRLSGTVGWGVDLSKRYAIGTAVQVMRQSIAATHESSWALYTGLLARAGRRFRYALAYSQLDSRPAHFHYSGTWRAGTAWMPFLRGERHTVVTTAMTMPPYGLYRAQVGVEQVVMPSFALRAGYQSDLQSNQISGFRGLTAGFGLKVGGLNLDYAYLPNGTLGTSHSFGLNYAVDNGSAKSDRPSRPRRSSTVTSSGRVPPLSPTPTPVIAHPTPTPTATEGRLKLYFSLPVHATPTAVSETPEFKAAQAQWMAALEKDPKDVRSWIGLGFLYQRAGRRAETIQCFEQVLRLQPGAVKVRKWLKEYKAQTPGREYPTPPGDH